VTLTVSALRDGRWLFLDYNPNAKDRTACSAYSVRPVPDARVSMPLRWEEVADCEPAYFTVATVPGRFARHGDPHAEMDAASGSLDGLLDLAARDEASGLGDALWPPHLQKMYVPGDRGGQRSRWTLPARPGTCYSCPSPRGSRKNRRRT
jgi:bifunctional non-homologous end joining protein LigD